MGWKDTVKAPGWRETIKPATKEAVQEEAAVAEPTLQDNIDGARANFGKAAPFMGVADKIVSAAYALPAAFSDDKTFGDEYDKNVKFYRDEREKSAKKGSKAAQIAGTAAGIGANLVVPTPGAKMAGIAGIGARLAGNAGMAALDEGAKADTLDEAADRAKVAGKEALKWGSLFEALGIGKKGYDALTKGTQKTADKMAWRAAIGQNQKLAEEIGDHAAAGARLREMGIVSAGNTPEHIRAKLVASQQKAGKARSATMGKVDEAYKAAAEAGALEKLGADSIDDLTPDQLEEFSKILQSAPTAAKGKDVGDFIRSQMGPKLPEFPLPPQKRTETVVSDVLDQFGVPFSSERVVEEIPKPLRVPGQETVRSKTDEVADFFDKLNNPTLSDLQRAKGTFNFKLKDPHTHAVPQDVQNAAKSAVGKVQEDAVRAAETHFPEELKGVAKDYSKANSDYGFLASLAKGVKKNAARVDSNTYVGLAGPMAAGGIATGGDLSPTGLARAAGAMALYRQGKMRGASTGQAMLNRLAGVMRGGGKFADILAKANTRGSAALAATHAVLMNDPEYRKMIEEGGDE